MAVKYLDETGLAYLWAKIKAYVDSHAGSGTPTPTANATSAFDSSAKMNSTDMTSAQVSDFVDSLSGSGIAPVDYIVEQGTSGIWTYRKWNSGIAECWGTNVTTGTFSAWGQGYSCDVPAISYPTNLFVSPPTVVINSQFTSGNAVSSASGGGNKDQTPLAILIRLGAAPSGTLTFNTWYQAKGRWK